MHLAKTEEASSEENTNNIAEQTFNKGIMSIVHGFGQPSQQKPGLEVQPLVLRNHQQRLMGTEKIRE